MRTLLHPAIPVLIVAALLAVGQSGNSFARSVHVPMVPAAVAAEDGTPRGDVLSRADRALVHAMLHSAPVTLELPTRSNWGPSRQAGAQMRRAVEPVVAPALTAIRARAAIASHLDFAAALIAVRAGALSSRTTCIPPPIHA